MKKIGVMKPDQIVLENTLKQDVVATVNYAWVMNFSIMVVALPLVIGRY